MPRLNVVKQQLYKLDRTQSYGRLDDVIRGTVDTAIIREQWDQLVRLAASLHNRTAPAYIVLRRLASSAPSDRFAKALTALGRALRSLYFCGMSMTRTFEVGCNSNSIEGKADTNSHVTSFSPIKGPFRRATTKRS